MVTRADLLERLPDSQSSTQSAELARYILSLHFPSADHARCSELSAKAQDGTLTPEETVELDEYLAASDVLATLQSNARKSLKSLNPAA